MRRVLIYVIKLIIKEYVWFLEALEVSFPPENPGRNSKNKLSIRHGNGRVKGLS